MAGMEKNIKSPGRNGCSQCELKGLCLPATLSPAETIEFEAIIPHKREIKRGATVFSEGDAFDALYAIRKGVFKTFISLDDTHKQTMGFHVAGEMIGSDGLATERHTCTAVALEDGQVCVLPFEKLERLAADIPDLQRHLYRTIGQEIVRCQKVMLLLGNMHADVRLATFLLELMQRRYAHDTPANELVLPMTRGEIGNYIGLEIETISRALSRLKAQKIIPVKSRHLQIIDPKKLQQLVVSRMS